MQSLPRLAATPCLAFVAGTGALQLAPALPPVFATALAAAALACAALVLPRALSRRRPSGHLSRPAARYLPPLLALLAAFACGLAYANWRADYRLHNTLPPNLTWKDIVVEGRVDGAPNTNHRRSRFDFVITKIIPPPAAAADAATLPRLPLRARLSDYHHGKPAADIAAGNHLRLTVRLRPPAATINPRGFDYAGYLFAANIRLWGYIRGRAPAPPDAAAARPAPPTPRQQIRQRIAASAAPRADFIAALVIGDRSGLDEKEWRVLQNTGTAHLVSVSGVHIGIILFMVAALLGGLWRRFPALTARMPAAPAACLLALPAALAYALLAGFAVPVQRSFFMATAAIGALFMGGAGAALAALAAAAAIVCLLDPWAATKAGFWLSFLLTAAVLAAARGADNPWRKLVGLQLVLSIIAIPLTQWFFNQASLVSPLANFIAIPVVGFVALPLALAGALLGDWCWFLAGHLLQALWLALEFLQRIPHAAIFPAAPPLWFFALALAGAAWLLLPTGMPLRAAGLLPIIAMLLYTPPAPAAGELRMTVLDVGQGTAVALQTQNSVTIYDTGRHFGGRIVAEYLRSQGLQKINTLIISHDDYDHRGGMAPLLARLPADSIIASDGDMHCQQGMTWQQDGVKFSALYPPANRRIAPENKNDDSCVLLVETAGGMRVLLTGDISDQVEWRVAVPAHVLLVAHHGSRHSTTADFLQKVAPRAAIISAGQNDYHHPHPELIARLRQAGSQIYRTDQDGAIIATLGHTLSLTRQRQQNPKYWR